MIYGPESFSFQLVRSRVVCHPLRLLIVDFLLWASLSLDFLPHSSTHKHKWEQTYPLFLGRVVHSKLDSVWGFVLVWHSSAPPTRKVCFITDRVEDLHLPLRSFYSLPRSHRPRISLSLPSSTTSVPSSVLSLVLSEHPVHFHKPKIGCLFSLVHPTKLVLY